MQPVIYSSLLTTLLVTITISVYPTSAEDLSSESFPADRPAAHYDTWGSRPGSEDDQHAIKLRLMAKRSRRSAGDELIPADNPEGLNQDKRSWSSGKNMAVWGKRDDVNDDVMRDDKRKWSSGNMAVWGKRKWSSGNMAVWGKRRSDDEEEKRNGDEGEESLNERKRKWSERNMAVWG